jgi:hypothetical protein
MNRRHCPLLTLILGTCAVAIASTGCRRESVPATPERPTPEESFSAIVVLVKDGIELPGGGASGFVAQRTGASSRFQVHNTVSSHLIPPATPNDPYRGTITVTSQSIYSIRRSAEEAAERKKKDEQDASADRGFSLLDDPEDSGSGFNSFDQGLVSDSSDDEQATAAEIESVQRRPDKVDRTYDLVYQSGRWELTSKLDPKTEASVENAFQRALRLQP